MKNCIKADAVSAFNSTGLSTSYQALNASGFSGPTVLMRIYNASNRDITISYDGTHDHDFVPTTQWLTLNFQTNAAPNNYVAMMKKGTIVYLKGASAGTGLIYLATYYLEQ
jgi:hypothetical protein